MKKITRHLLAFSVAACLVAGLSACGNSSSEDTSANSAAEAIPVTESEDTASSADVESASSSALSVLPSGELVGIFKMVEMTSPDETFSADDLAQAETAGVVLYIVFSEDGSLYLNSDGEESTGTWDDSGITIEGEEVAYSLDGDTLVLTEDDVVLTFTRTTQEEIDAILANGVSDAESDTAASESDSDYVVGGDYSTEEKVLFETDDCVITITGYDTEDYYYGFIVNVRCENRTSDKTLGFSAGDAAINGYMFVPFFGDEATAGNSVNGEIEFDRTEMQQAGITSVDELTIEINVYDSETYDTLYNDTVTVYPTGMSADQVVYPERTPSADDTVVIDDDDVTFIITGMDHDDLWDAYEVTVYMENKTDRTLMYYWDNVAVNGAMIDPYWAKEVLSGKKAYAEIRFYDSSLEENGITDITSIEYKLGIRDADDWVSDNLVEETFTYTP